MSTESAGAGRGSRTSAVGAIWPPPREGWIALLGVALLFVGHWVYGALVNDTAFVMGIGAALLVGAVLITPRLRDDLLRLKTLRAPAVAFGLTLAIGFWTLTPWTPGGPHPVWAYMGLSPGASTIDRSSTIAELIKLMGLGCFFLVGAATGGHDGRARYAVRSMLVLGFVFGLWAFVRTMTGGLEVTVRRLEANFLNANTAGLFFAILTICSLPEVRRPANRRGSAAQGLGLLAVFTFLVCLIATVSRGAVVGVTAGGLAYLVLLLSCGRLKLSRAAIAGVAALGVMGLLVAISGGLIVDRFALAGKETLGRTVVWSAHWRAFLDSPLFGYGLGTSETVNKTLITPENVQYLIIIRGLMNVYLQWLEQAGLVGAAPMLAAIGLVIWTTIRGALRRNRMQLTLCALLAVDAVVLVHGATDFGLEVFSMAAMWAWLLGLQFGLAQGSSTR